MNPKLFWKVLTVTVLAAILFVFAMAWSDGPVRAFLEAQEEPVKTLPLTEKAGPAKLTNPEVSQPVSPADTRGLPPAPRVDPSRDFTRGREIPNNFPLPNQERTAGAPQVLDPAVQRGPVLKNMPATTVNFEGVGNVDGVAPPDTDGQVGPNHYVQMVNLSTAIYDKAGNLLYGPFHPSDLWPSGDPCNVNNDGDVVVLYDQLADRWLLTQFAVPGPYYQCIAVSKGPVPTNNPNDWYPYTFQVHATKFNDYPKLGVWPDGYYMSANQFTATWAGAGVWVFDRAAMLTGSPATFQYFDVADIDINYGGLLPSNLMGNTLPPSGAPNYFMSVDQDWSGTDDILHVFEFHTDWATPANSTFGLVADWVVDPFDWDLCTASREACIHQPGTTNQLEAISDRLMMHLWYRNFGSHESLVLNHTVDANGAGRAGIRWYEVRGGTVNTTLADGSVYQQGTYFPDTDHRWMGSIAMDHVGNIALGYSVSSETTYPSIRYTGRLTNDPLGTLPQGEASVIAGGGSQTDPARWGDYSAMSVDPVDDCTFWYTQEYIQSTGSWNWQTRIAAFKFPNCTAGPAGTLTGQVYDASTSGPIVGASVVAAGTLITHTGGTTSGSGGLYTMVLPVDTYTVTANAYGYQPTSIASVGIVSGTTTTQDIPLTPAAMYVVSGTVTDAATGWPLYAHLTIAGDPVSPPPPSDEVWTDPVSGYYSVTLAEGITYTFNVEAWVPGYLPANRDVGPLTGDTTEDFALDVDAATCNAPGYVLDVTGGIDQDFETWPPAGWSVVDNAGGLVWDLDTAYGDGNYTGGAGHAADVNSDANPGVPYDTELRTYAFDLASLGDTSLTYLLNFQSYSGLEALDLDISTDGGGAWTNLRHWTTDQGTLYSTPGVSDTVDLSPYAAETNVMLRWRYYTSESDPWDWYAQIDEVRLGGPATLDCYPQPGGLVVGNVYDDNTNLPLVGANVENEDGYATTALATPDDPAVDDAFYTLFSPAGSKTFTATMSGGYGPDAHAVTVVQSNTVGLEDFYLPAGLLSYTPPNYHVTQPWGMSTTLPMTLTNAGGLGVSYEMVELDKGWDLLGPFETPHHIVKPFKQNRLTAEGLGMGELPEAPPYAAGDIIQTWPTGLVYGWGLGYNLLASDLWIGNLAAAGGDDLDYRFLTDGTNTGDTIDTSAWAGTFAADMAFNPNTGMLWQLDVAGGDCIHELDPVNLVTTGNTMCPAFGTSQRGLAYDPTTDTYFAGSWNDLMIHHFASDGSFIRQVNVGLAVAGLAYNPDTQHLFVMVNDDPNDTIYVLDAADPNFALVGQFTLSGFSAYGGAGMGMDCDGNLWAVDQNTQTVYQFESGETTSMCAFDVPWLSEDPISGTLPFGDQIIDLTFDAAQVSQPGHYYAQLKVGNDTPYNVANMPLTMTVTPSPDWGKVAGVVTDRCTGGGVEAHVVISGGVPITETWADEFGNYGAWLEQGSYDFSYSAAGYITQTLTVTVTSGLTTTQDVVLTPDRPCIAVDPDMLEVWVLTGTLVYTHPLGLNLTNAGAQPLNYEIVELDGGYAPPMLAVYTPPASDGMAENLLQYAPADVVYGAPTSGPNVPMQMILLDQPPNQSNGFFSDAGCDNCSSGAHTIAENFALSAQETIGEIVFWTGYYPNDVPIDPDHITVIFHTDAAGLPGAAISTQTNVPYSRVQTGVVLFGVHEWMHTLTLGSPVTLGPGTYWVEIYNDTGFGTDDFFWEVGDPDTVGNGLPGSAWSTTAPGSGWSFDGTTELAVQLVRAPGDVPWVWEDPISGTVPSDTNFNVDIMFTALYTDMVTPMPLGTYTATLLIDNDDPVAGAQQVSVTMHIVEQFVAPTASFVSNSPVCLGSTAVFTNTSNPGVPAATYLWTFGDGMTSTLESPTHLYGADGTYTVTLEACNTVGCDTYTDTVEVQPLPVAGFDYAVDQLTVVFTNTSANATSYLWNFGDTATSTDENPTHSYAAAGTYTVTLTATGECGVDVYSAAVTLSPAPAPNYAVDVSATDTALAGYVGEVVSYTLTIQNNGTVTDTFDVSLSGNAWTTVASPLTVGPLGVGATDALMIYVTIPSDAADGATDAVLVRLTSQGDSGQSDSVMLTTTAMHFKLYLPLTFKD